MGRDMMAHQRIESELITGLIRAKAWKPSPERVKELQQSRITKQGKLQNPSPQP